MKAKGFTLIELLVVIAIIAILAAILFPVFARARENARRSACQSNLKQIGLGLMQYSQDYDETMPFDHVPGASAYAGVWMDSIQPNVKSDQVFNCPSHAFAASGSTGIRPYSSTNVRDHWNKTFGSYTINSTYCRDDAGLGLVGTPVSYGGQDGGSVQVVKMAQVATPSTTVFAADSSGEDYGTGTRAWFMRWYQSAAQPDIGLKDGMRTFGTADGRLMERHLGTVNVLWMDGHVKAMKIDALGATRSSGPSANATYLFTRQDD